MNSLFTISRRGKNREREEKKREREREKGGERDPLLKGESLSC